MEKEERVDEFYHYVQLKAMEMDKEHNLRYITSRSTEGIENHIDVLCKSIQLYCVNAAIPTEGDFLRKNDLCVKAFMYLFCNTNFTSQSLLSEDIVFGHLVDIQPPFSTYLFIEILWYLKFEDILAESFLHFPIDLGVEILEVLPRCIDLLDYERSSKFLMALITNVYKKLIILHTTGDQTTNINDNARKLAGNLQELFLQFTNERFLRMDIIKNPSDRYKRYGTLLKSIIQMVRICLSTKTNVEIPCEMVKMYKLTYGREPFEKIDEIVLKELLTEIDRELINLLLKKVKEIDCNIYLNWTEHDDKENTSLTLQRAIGLESYFFMQNTQQYQNSNIKEYNHLVECLQQISSKPDPESSVESLQMVDLYQGVREGKLEFLMALFRRYKEWDISTMDSINSNISLMDKTSCEEIFEYLVGEMSHSGENHTNLQLCIRYLTKALAHLQITELYEIAITFILKSSEKNNLNNVIDINNFEKFIMLNPNLSTSKNLRIVLIFLCLNSKYTLKILLKMAIGHPDYPDVAITLDDLMLLRPVLIIQTHSKYETIVNSLRPKCLEKKESLSTTSASAKSKNNEIDASLKEETKAYKLIPVTLVVQILQDICLECPGWNGNKFSSLLQYLYTFCNVSEVINEIFTSFLFSKSCSAVHLKYFLVELQKLVGKFKCEEINPDLISAFDYQGLKLLMSNNISRYLLDELLTMIQNLREYFNDKVIAEKKRNISEEPVYTFFMSHSLKYIIAVFRFLHKIHVQNDSTNYPKNLLDDDVLRYLMLKSTKKQYLAYISQVIELKMLRCNSEIDAIENFVKLTLESCLLCLEYPDVTAPDSVGFLLRCLLQLLSTVDYKSSTKNYKRLCESLQNNIIIFKDTIRYTYLENVYSELLKTFQNVPLNLDLLIEGIEQLACVSTQGSDKLKNYEAQHSPLAIELWLRNDIIDALLERNLKDEEHLKKIAIYL